MHSPVLVLILLPVCATDFPSPARLLLPAGHAVQPWWAFCNPITWPERRPFDRLHASPRLDFGVSLRVGPGFTQSRAALTFCPAVKDGQSFIKASQRAAWPAVGLDKFPGGGKQ